MKIPPATFKCAECGVKMASFRFGRDGRKLLANYDLWTQQRRVYYLCALCSRERWNRTLAEQPVGSDVDVIVHNGCAENVTHTWRAILVDWCFKDSGGGVWKATRQPTTACARVRFVKMVASNNKPTEGNQ